MTHNDFILDDMPTVPQTFHQLGILVLDGSGSMSDMAEGKVTKADAVNIGVRELLTRLIASKNSKDFSIAVVTFDTHARIHTATTRVDDGSGNTIDDNNDYNPLNGHGGGTDIGEGLKVAHSLAEQFLASAPPDSVPHSVVIVVMSDGMSGGDPISIANAIKQNPKVTICTTLFARKGDSDTESQRAQQLLKEIASSPVHYKTVYDAETLRKFFIASVSSGKNVNIR